MKADTKRAAGAKEAMPVVLSAVHAEVTNHEYMRSISSGRDQPIVAIVRHDHPLSILPGGDGSVQSGTGS